MRLHLDLHRKIIFQALYEGYVYKCGKSLYASISDVPIHDPNPATLVFVDKEKIRRKLNNQSYFEIG